MGHHDLRRYVLIFCLWVIISTPIEVILGYVGIGPENAFRISHLLVLAVFAIIFFISGIIEWRDKKRWIKEVAAKEKITPRLQEKNDGQ